MEDIAKGNQSSHDYFAEPAQSIESGLTSFSEI